MTDNDITQPIPDPHDPIPDPHGPTGDPADAPAPPLFVRPRKHRMVAGVCAGIAERWGLDLTLVRIVTVVTTLISGVGLAVYVAAWLLTPSTDGPAPLRAESRAARWSSRNGERLMSRLGVLLLIVVAAIVVSHLAHALWWGAPVGFLVALLIAALVFGTRRGRWLLTTLAALLILGLATVGIFGEHFGSRTVDVASVDDLHYSYDYGAGKLALDLSAISAVSGRHETKVHLGRGDVTVTVPRDITVVVHARAGVGSVTVDGHHVSGFDAEQTQTIGAAAATAADKLVVDVTVGAGRVTIR